MEQRLAYATVISTIIGVVLDVDTPLGEIAYAASIDAILNDKKRSDEIIRLLTMMGFRLDMNDVDIPDYIGDTVRSIPVGINICLN